MIKVAMIGAGSVVFSKNLTGDILSYPEFRDATFTYMDIDADRLSVGAALCRKMADSLGANPTIETTLDRRVALNGADFVINMVQIGGFDSTLVDFEIPRKYGLNFTIADTTGPGGLFRALRTYPMLRGLVHDMADVCPRAVLLNYSNPMSMNMQTIFRGGESGAAGIRAVGLCHSVQGTFNQLMGYIGEKPEDIAFICAGINHMAFYLRMEKAGVDLYPRLFEAMHRPEVYNTNRVRFELMKRLGHFVTESSEHNAEYSPYFIPHGMQSITKFGVPIDEYLRRCEAIVEEFDRLKKFSASSEPMPCVRRSHEYGSTIIHSMTSGKPSVVYGNMPNNGAIGNLPATAIVEAPTLVDRTGLHFLTVGDLPPQLVGYMQPHVTQHELFIRAANEGRRDHIYQAAMFDPLTAATLPLDKIVEMCDELIAAHGNLLPNLDAKRTLVPGSGLKFEKVDPARLHQKRNQAREKAAEDYLLEWNIIGPFKNPEPGKITLGLATPVEDEFLKRDEGTIDLSRTYGTGDQIYLWKPATACKRNGLVNLTEQLGAVEWCAGYAYAEINSIHPRQTVLRCGSDDGIKIWLNGRVVHQNELMRGYSPNSDEVPIDLFAGVNRLLVKITNARHGWGFGVAVGKALF